MATGGRQLDITDETDFIEGDTAGLFVSRWNLLSDAFVELPYVDNIRLPLNITFNGECASDLGGPRKEFLSLCIAEIQTKFLDGNTLRSDLPEELARHRFFYAGLLVGMYELSNFV
jgi:hypothetical protein